MSIPLDMVKKNLKNYFFVYAPQWLYWPLEVHYLNAIIARKSTETLAETYVENNTILHDSFSKIFLQNYLIQSKKIIKKYQSMKSAEVIDYILKTANKWDNYTLSLLFLKYLKYFNQNGFVNNTFNKFFATLLVTNVHPNPEKRATASQTFDNFDKFFYDPEINNTQNLLDILEHLISTRDDMNVAIKEDIKREKKLIQKLRSKYASFT